MKWDETTLLQYCDVLFLQGGATHQFSMIPLNFSKLNSAAAYITTGTWTKRAFEEGSKIAKIDQIFTSEDKNFTYAPNFKDLKIFGGSLGTCFDPSISLPASATAF